jgi:hypothetical protein
MVGVLSFLVYPKVDGSGKKENSSTHKHTDHRFQVSLQTVPGLLGFKVQLPLDFHTDDLELAIDALKQGVAKSRGGGHECKLRIETGGPTENLCLAKRVVRCCTKLKGVFDSDEEHGTCELLLVSPARLAFISPCPNGRNSRFF